MAKTTTRPTKIPTLPPAQVPKREEQIALRAYLRAEQRGFVPGGELDDWLAAEREIDATRN